MKYFEDQLTETQADQFGRASAALLRQGAESLPVGIKDRLHAARMKALSVGKAEKVRVQTRVLAGATSNWGSQSSGLWDAMSWVAPLAVLVFGWEGEFTHRPSPF